jgi:Skp family chaperone for outer membrane proteins
MKRIALLFLALALTAPLTASAQETAAAAGKNPCLLNSANCPESSLTIQEQIARLQTEAKKGSAVYSAEELKVLQAKIDDAQNLLTAITGP